MSETAGSVMGVARSLLDARGRLSRRGFWMVYAGVGVYSMLVTLPLMLLSGPKVPAAVVVLVTAANAPAFYVLALAIVRRLHDRGRSGAFATAYLIIPVSAVVTSFAPPVAFVAGIALIVVAQIVLLWGIIELLLLRGQAGSNRFGPDPLAGDAS